MNNDGKLFYYDITNWLIYETGFKNSQYKMSIYYNYAPDGYKLVLLSYVGDFVDMYTYEELGKWFVDTIGNRIHVNFLGYSYWFMSIFILQLKDY